MDLRKLTIVLGLAALIACYGWSAGSPESEEIEMRVLWWGPQDRNEKTVAALDDYASRNPGMTITPEYLGFEAFADKLATQVAAGAAPDVIQFPYRLLPEYVERGALRPVDEYVPDILNLNTFAPEALTIVTVGDHIYGAPTGVSGGCIYYDIALFEALGIETPDYTWTWDDFRSVAQQIADGTEDGFYGTFDAGGYRGGLEAYVRGLGKQFFTEDGELGFSKQDLVEWLTMWEEMRQSGAAVPADVQATWQQRIDMHMIVQGKAAIDFEFASVTFQPLVDKEIGILTVPHGPETLGTSVEAVNPWVISNDSEVPMEAAKLIEFLVNDPEGARILKHARGIPPSSIAREVLRPTASPHDLQRYEFFDLLGQVGSEPATSTPPGGSEVQQRLLIETNEQVAFGKMSVEDAADRFIEESRRILGY